jgi:ferredoxin-NADP reductase
VPCWLYPWVRTIFEYGINQKAQIFVEDNGFTRITIPADFKWQPGQHCFLRFRSFGINALSSHPFTICSLPSTSPEKPSELVFYIRHREGFTAKLYNLALKQPGVQVPVFVDGPYGGIDNEKYFGSDRLVVVAGGSGAGWMLPFVEQYLRYLSLMGMQGTMAEDIQDNKQTSDGPLHQQLLPGPRSLRVILATRDLATRTWFHTTLNSLLSDYKSLGTPSDLSVEVHLTGEAERIVRPPTKSASDLERSSSSSSGEVTIEKHAVEPKKSNSDEVPEEEVCGRPDLPSTIREEAAAGASTGQRVGVFVCGPLTMQDDVRNAVAKENLNILKNPRSGGMYLHLEHFSWA